MGQASFEYEGDEGRLNIITHFGESHTIVCTKHSDEFFRLGGTAINEVMIFEGIILNLNHPPIVTFRAFKDTNNSFDDTGWLSPEKWDESDLHCFIHEYYPLDMEGHSPQWFVSKQPIENAHHIFVNLDILDGGGNVLKRHRVSTFTGQCRVMEAING